MSPEEYAWRVHEALNDWTSKVDFKASIVFAIEAAIATVVVGLSAAEGPLHGLHGIRETLFRISLIFIGTAVVFCGWVVMPQLRRRSSARRRMTWRTNTIYFGHLRHWPPEELERRLRDEHRGDLAQLCRQLVTMSDINWKKHSRLQWSLLSLAVGLALLVPASISA